MNFREFVQAAEGHLARQGWKHDGHNGVWPIFMKGTRRAFTEALIHELWRDATFDPFVERYLVGSGWQRVIYVMSAGSQLFVRDGVYKTMYMALIEQLKQHRLDRAAMVPPTTPADMKKILDVTQFRQTPVAR